MITVYKEWQGITRIHKEWNDKEWQGMTMNDKGYGIEKNDKELYGIIRVERIGKEQLGKPEKADESTDGQSSPGGLATCSNLLRKKNNCKSSENQF